MIKTTRTDKIRPYSAPTLSTFGSVTKLTAAGTSGVAEAGSGSSNKLKP